MAGDSVVVYIGLLMTSWIGLAVAVVFFSLSWFDIGTAINFFMSKNLDIWKNNEIEAFPSEWTYWVWISIFILQAIWLIYGLTLLCKRGEEGYSYADTPVVGGWVYFIFTLALASSVAWLFFWERPWLFRYAALCLLVASVLLYICLAMVAVSTYQFTPVYLRRDAQGDLWSLRLFVHNGIAAFATWTTVMCLLNATIMISHHGGYMDQSFATSIFMGVLMAYTIFWFGLDVVAGEEMSRYMVLPYFVVLLTYIGTIYRNWHIKNLNLTISFILVGLSGILTLIKVAAMIGRHRSDRMLKGLSTTHRKPVFPAENNHTSTENLYASHDTGL